MKRAVIQQPTRGQILQPLKPKKNMNTVNRMTRGNFPNYPVIQGSSESEVQQFNKDNGRYIQSFRSNIVQGNNNVPISLNSSGYFFEGLSFSLGAFTGLQDTQINFAINGRNLLVNVSALILIPNYVQGNMLFYPLPQPLTGKDTFSLSLLKNDAGTVTVYTNIVYRPQL